MQLASSDIASRRMHILIADDRRDNRELLEQAFSGQYRITMAAGGEETIACIRGDRPDLLLLDLLMPDIDGYDILAHLANHPEPFLPVIVLSAVTKQGARLFALQQGAHEFLSRPFDLDELTVRVQTMLSLKAARRRLEERADDLESSVAERTRELQEAVEKLETADHYKDEFLGVISHELRTPLNFIMGFASILEDGVVGELSEPQAALTARILDGADRMLGLVNNLLDMSLLATGKMVLSRSHVQYAELVSDVVVALEPLATARGVTVVQDVSAGATVEVDVGRTCQLLTHLVGNALKFTNAGGQVSIRAFVRGPELVTEIIDTGIGIPTDAQERIFTRLQQLDMSPTRKHGGSGLGLSLSKGIVEAHGGRIGMRSILGIGSTFWFDLPIEAPVPVVSISRAS